MSRIAVTGAAGLLGGELIHAIQRTGGTAIALTHHEIDLEDRASLRRIAETRPDVVINAAAWTDVDGCALDPERAMRINAEGAASVAAEAARAGALLVQISTNEVFAGESGRTYAEHDEPKPINSYGASKLAGERAVARTSEGHLIVRTAWLYGPDRGFPARIIAAAEHARKSGTALRVVDDEWGNPTPANELAQAIASVIHRSVDGLPRILHLAGEPPASRWAWAAKSLSMMKDPLVIEPIRQSEYQRASRVPPHAVLDTRLSRKLGISPIQWMTS